MRKIIILTIILIISTICLKGANVNDTIYYHVMKLSEVSMNVDTTITIHYSDNDNLHVLCLSPDKSNPQSFMLKGSVGFKFSEISPIPKGLDTIAFEDYAEMHFSNEKNVFVNFYPLKQPKDTSNTLIISSNNSKDTLKIHLQFIPIHTPIPTPVISVNNDSNSGGILSFGEANQPWGILLSLLLPVLLGVISAYFFFKQKLSSLGEKVKKQTKKYSLLETDSNKIITNQTEKIATLATDLNEKKSKLKRKEEILTSLRERVQEFQVDNNDNKKKIKSLEEEVTILKSLGQTAQTKDKVEYLKNILTNINNILHQTKSELKNNSASQTRFFKYFHSFIEGDKQKKGVNELLNILSENKLIYDKQSSIVFFENFIQKEVWPLVSFLQKLTLYSKITTSKKSFESELKNTLGLKLKGINEVYEQLEKYFLEIYEVSPIPLKLMKDKLGDNKYETSRFNQLGFFGYGAMISELPEDTIFDLVESGFDYSKILKKDKSPIVSVRKT